MLPQRLEVPLGIETLSIGRLTQDYKGVSMAKIWLFLSLTLIALWQLPTNAIAGGVVEISGSYTEGDPIRNDPHDTGGNKKVTLGTLLVHEIPGVTQRYISVGTTEDKFSVSDIPGSITFMSVTNRHATVPAYLKCHKDTLANTAPGTDTVDWSLDGIANGGEANAYPHGFSFTALTCWIVLGKADSDVAEVAANDIVVKLIKKVP